MITAIILGLVIHLAPAPALPDLSAILSAPCSITVAPFNSTFKSVSDSLQHNGFARAEYDSVDQYAVLIVSAGTRRMQLNFEYDRLTSWSVIEQCNSRADAQALYGQLSDCIDEVHMPSRRTSHFAEFIDSCDSLPMAVSAEVEGSRVTVTVICNQAITEKP